MTGIDQTASTDDGRRRVLGVTRSAGERTWRERLTQPQAATALAIAQRLGVPEVVARVMAARDVPLEAAERFLDPTIKDLMPDPSSLSDMEAAVARVADAVGAGARIAIFGDYDVDGATSSAVLSRYLSAIGIASRIHIPDRIIEGYGPNGPAIRMLREEGAGLLVCVDCGSVSFEAFAEAREVGLDVVVLDHHQVGEELPATAALVNPNRQDDLSGLGHLAAVGVTFVFLVGLNRELRRRGMFRTRREPDLLALLDLVAVGTVCDVVPLKGLNRAFVRKGLLAMHGRANAGLAALGDVSRVHGRATPYHLGFMIGPRINAGGRIGDAALGARLLTTDDMDEARTIAERLDGLNAERQAIEAEMLLEGDAQALIATQQDDPAVLLTGSPGWHPGVVGLVAARLKERYRRPAFAIAYDVDGKGTGSGRSIPGVDLGAAVRRAVDEKILEKGGGHAMAAGLTVRREKLADLAAFLQDALAEDVAAARSATELKIDGAMTAGAASADLLHMLETAGPFGAGHPEPVFAFPSHRVTFADTVGKGHVRLTLADGGGSTLKAIAFKAADTPLGQAILGARGSALHVAGALSLDTWQGQERVQLRVIDVADPQRSRL
ncbi:single-stranded-DNA-specific exonuclease RecJ [Stappia sp. 28M-7]|uniref:single-stranded-DNA-specific exonuclease RecJ n=1 Tax=Stappia sp. 28M-7 TaxID=2762596 RepID=UPI00163C4AE7|nr:single-stranded-DNA-specific exonuclease RecJ [Stappia sp. 28M-7]MBC2859374.1 single-stranded-DNA-specific exonuclease RecJ [Stappia sp. 28M-7]